MKFYYVALTINKEQPVSVRGGRKLAYYTKKYPAIKQCDDLNGATNIPACELGTKVSISQSSFKFIKSSRSFKCLAVCTLSNRLVTNYLHWL